MVLESLIGPLKAEKKPWEMFLVGFAFAAIALVLALWIFRTYASLVMVFFAAAASIPLMVKTIKVEEKKDMTMNNEVKILKEHSKALASFMFLFLGMMAAFVAMFVLLPNGVVQDSFYSQMQTISNINTKVTAKYTNQFETFTHILFNNVRVLSFCILFSFIYGAGAIFILTWNASVIGAAMGNFIRVNLSKAAISLGALHLGNYLQIVSLGIFRYMIHGIPEILAYFVGGLAGGIISFAVVNHDFRTKKFENVVLDSSELIIIALFMLVVASFLETYVSLALF